MTTTADTNWTDVEERVKLQVLQSLHELSEGRVAKPDADIYASPGIHPQTMRNAYRAAARVLDAKAEQCDLVELLAHMLAHGRHEKGACDECDAARRRVDEWLVFEGASNAG